MKCLIVAALVLITIKVSAQSSRRIDTVLNIKMNPEDPGLPLKEVGKHLGENVYVRNFVVGRKIINDSVTILYLGGKYPNHILSIFIKGKQLNEQTARWWNQLEMGHFHGIVILYKGKPAIVITSQWQLSTAIEI